MVHILSKKRTFSDGTEDWGLKHNIAVEIFQLPKQAEKKIVTRNKTRKANTAICASTVKRQVGCICLFWHCVLSGFCQLGCASTLEWEVLAVWDVLPPLTWFLVAGSGDPSLVLSTEHKTGVRFLMPLVIRRSSYTFERINRKWWWHLEQISGICSLDKREEGRENTYQLVCKYMFSCTAVCCGCTSLLPSDNSSVHPKWFNYISSVNNSN